MPTPNSARTDEPDAPALTWFHIILTVYAAWLPGDPRGFRTRHHRNHVEGDYLNPPEPGSYNTWHDHARESLTAVPVCLSWRQKRIVGEAIRDDLESRGGIVACVAVAAKHVHALAKVATGEVRAWAGSAKSNAWFRLRETGFTQKLWAGGGKFVPIRDRQHQLNAYGYILRHADEGAWIWKFSDRGAEDDSLLRHMCEETDGADGEMMGAE